MSNMLEMRLDKRHPGRCNECRVEFERESIHPCLVCSQMLCDSCLPDGCHNWCVAPTAWAMPLRTLKAPATATWDAAAKAKTLELEQRGVYSETVAPDTSIVTVKPEANSADVPSRTTKLDAAQFRRDMLNPMDPSLVRTVGMGTLKPQMGVDLLRRRHCTDGHPALSVTVKNLKAEGAFTRKLVTLQDIELFQKQGCGACELTKMRRRAFKVKVNPDDVMPPKLGKFYTFDVLELRVPAEHTGATFFYVVVEKRSKFAMGGTMRGYSEANVMSALNEIKSRVRPSHGEIEIIRMDSHPCGLSLSLIHI